MSKMCSLLVCVAMAAAATLAVRAEENGKKKVVFVAGRPSHGYASHEHFAGCMLLAQSLEANVPNFQCVVVRDGYPKDPSAFSNCDAVVVFSDGGGGHPFIGHLQEIDALAEKGVGIGCLHYGVEVPKGEAGDHFVKWIGGYFEPHWSVNPHWTAKFTEFPKHPIARGVEPFEADDEWYYHMRFRPNMEGVTPILSALPPPETLKRPDGAHSNNPDVRAAVLERKEPQHLAWASERPSGQRGFGFTGGHWHWNWGNTSLRKVVLNGIVWIAHGEVPEKGVVDKPPTLEDLEKNQDYPPPADFDREGTRKRFNLPAAK
jgi:hypothetical protein